MLHEELVSDPSRRLWPWEWMLVVVQPLLLLAASLWSQTIQPEAFGLLWTEPAGRQMLIFAVGILSANAIILGVGSMLLERSGLGQTLRGLLAATLNIACFVLLFLPALWVLAIGPAVLQISQTLGSM
jgi:hypothetical protein